MSADAQAVQRQSMKSGANQTEPLMSAERASILLPGASRASHLVSPGSDEARGMTVTSGRKWRELLPRYGPRFVVAENVAGFVNMGLDECLADLEALGYEARAVVLPACAVGAPHRRDRVWIIAADPNAPRRGLRRGAASGQGGQHPQLREDVPDAAVVAQREPADEAEALGVGRQARHEPLGGGALLPTPTGQDAHNNGGPSQSERNTPPLNAVAGGPLNPRGSSGSIGVSRRVDRLSPSETPSSPRSRT